MKIRTDFVTNSSSSSYITIVVTTVDGRKFKGEFDQEESYHDGGFSAGEAPSDEAMAQIENMQDLIEMLDQLYEGGIAEFEEYAPVFGEQQKDVIALKREDISDIHIHERIEGDNYASIITYDYKVLTGKGKMVEEYRYSDDCFEECEDEDEDEDE